MSYRVEFGQSLYESFYQEFLVLDATSPTGDPLPSDGIDHQFKVYGQTCDCGDWIPTGQIIASNSNGLIYPTTQRGISAIKAPMTAFGGLVPSGPPLTSYGQSPSLVPTLRHALIAVPANPADAKVLWSGTITFGEETMIPRLTLKVTPYYPSPNTPSPTATQLKIQLSLTAGQYDAIEAALPASPVDPARQTWATGGRVNVGGPLYNVIANTLSYGATAMAILLAAAAAQPT